MNKHDKHIVACTANAVLWLWNDLIQRSNGDCWFQQPARQAYQDSMNAMKNCELIEDYDVNKIMVKINGEWYDDRRVMIFKKKGKTIPL